MRIRHLLHCRCDAELEAARLAAAGHREVAEMWRERCTEAREDLYALEDKHDDCVPFWWAFLGAMALFWVGFWLGAA